MINIVSKQQTDTRTELIMWLLMTRNYTDVSFLAGTSSDQKFSLMSCKPDIQYNPKLITNFFDYIKQYSSNLPKNVNVH